MMRQLLAVGLVVSIAGFTRAEGPLSLGDPAPKLQVQEFVKGEPVKKFENGKTYVVEFWATWCGPCRQSIPHLTKLQAEHKDVVFIGVSVSEQDFDKVKPFVKEMGDKMHYRVAVDSVPAGKDADEGAMNKTWMTAAEQDGIPTAFVVDKDGKIAWIGHPMKLDKPLKLIVAGKWDAIAEKKRAKKIDAAEKKIEAAVKADDLKEALTIVDEAIKDDASLEESLGTTKFSLLCDADQAEKAAEYGRKLIIGVLKDDSDQLNDLAWSVVDPKAVQAKKPDPKLVRVAVDAAAKAVELTANKDAAVLDTLANAHFVAGDVDKAIAAQEKAVKLKPDDDELAEHLETFKKAKEKGDK
jgi:thiol-disulfide isomerase/thioredoxin